VNAPAAHILSIAVASAGRRAHDTALRTCQDQSLLNDVGLNCRWDSNGGRSLMSGLTEWKPSEDGVTLFPLNVSFDNSLTSRLFEPAKRRRNPPSTDPLEMDFEAPYPFVLHSGRPKSKRRKSSSSATREYASFLHLAFFIQQRPTNHQSAHEAKSVARKQRAEQTPRRSVVASA
jgi:hypothetical protein